MELSGNWKARLADDDVRRDGVGLDLDDSAWDEVAVPGHWRSSSAFATSDGPLLYRTRFHLDTPDAGQRRWVTLDGVMYQADVWLDGAYLGDPEGYFFPHTYDITALSRLADDHVLAVEVACASQAGRTSKRVLTGTLQSGDFVDPERNPGGIWAGVRVHETGPVRIDRLRVLCRDANEARAHLRLHARLDCDVTRTCRVRTIVDGRVGDEQTMALAKGVNEVDWNLDVDNPRLWWPWALGTQALTEVRVEIAVDGVTSDERQLLTGLREVAMSDWVISVNGEALFAKGANLAPTRDFLAEATPQEVRRDIELARELGLDLVRVNGHVARPELYDAADELGVLVWQDLPLQWDYARTVRKEAVRQARELVDLLGHHPSIVTWCGHSEPDGAADRRTAAGTSVVRRILQQQLPTWNRTILDPWIRRSFESADETRPIVTHSGVAPNLPHVEGSDSHLSFGWFHGEARDLEGFAATAPRLVRFVSEFGTCSVPDTDDFLEPARWPDLDWERLTDRHGLDLVTLSRHVPPHGYGSFDAWREATQRYQAGVLRHHIETLRRLKYRPTGGFCLMALADSRPAIGWGVLDHERHPKSAFGQVMEACRPVIVVSDRLPGSVTAGDALALDVHVVSDLRVSLDGVTCRATLSWDGGTHEWAWQGDIGPDRCARIGTVQFVVPDAPGDLTLDLVLDHGEAVVTNRTTTRIL